MIENDYYVYKKELEYTVTKLHEFKEICGDLTEEQINARDRGIKSCEKQIDYIINGLDEIKIELYDFIVDGGEVSHDTIEDLIYYLTIDMKLNNDDGGYNVNVLNEKINFLKSLL